MSIEAALADLTAAVKANSALLERVVAGQQVAIEKLEGGAKPASTRGRKPAAEQPKAETPAPAVTETPAPAPAAAAKPATALPKDADELKAFMSAWTGATDDVVERKARVDFLKAIAQELGVEAKFAALAGAEDGIKKTVFYINRKKEGLTVDFSADYDFDGDPAQDAVGNEDASDDDF